MPGFFSELLIASHKHPAFPASHCAEPGLKPSAGGGQDGCQGKRTPLSHSPSIGHSPAALARPPGMMMCKGQPLFQHVSWFLLDSSESQTDCTCFLCEVFEESESGETTVKETRGKLNREAVVRSCSSAGWWPCS